MQPGLASSESIRHRGMLRLKGKYIICTANLMLRTDGVTRSDRRTLRDNLRTRNSVTRDRRVNVDLDARV